MELVGTGKVTVNENNLSLVDYGFSADKDTADWSDDSADVLGDIQGWVDTMKDNGQPADSVVTTTTVLRRIQKNAVSVHRLKSNQLPFNVFSFDSLTTCSNQPF